MSNAFSRAAVVLNPRKDYQSLLEGIEDRLRRQNISLFRIILPHELPDLKNHKIPEPEVVDFANFLTKMGAIIHGAGTKTILFRELND